MPTRTGKPRPKRRPRDREADLMRAAPKKSAPLMRGRRRNRALDSHSEGAENVLFDLGLPEAPVLAFRAELAAAINKAIARRSLSDRVACRMMRMTRETLSQLRNYKLCRIPTEHLVGALTALGYSVKISVLAARGRRQHRSSRASR